MSVYLDNAATTSLDPDVFEAMRPYFLEHFGNPSSTHAHGRTARSAIETVRKKMAEQLQVMPSEIYFTSGGTEADNLAITGMVRTFGIRHVISTRIEHHAVLHTLGHLTAEGDVEVHFLDLDAQGRFDAGQLEELTGEHPESLVTLMHGNNEIGNLTDIKMVGEICRRNRCYYHSDTVQTVGKYALDLGKTPVDAIAGSAHKFHGPKGVGFLYLRSGLSIQPLLFGGGQERDLRPGTENVAGIVGLGKAFELARNELNRHQTHMQKLKGYMVGRLKEEMPGISFNGLSDHESESLYSLVNISLPKTADNEMTLFQLDLQGISASGGSACGSGALKGSHVITELRPDDDRINIRFSFNRDNTFDEIDYTLDTLKNILG